jgi:hypothetical protein
LSTGGGFGTRELYTDFDEVLFEGKRPIILNGIDDVATEPDLADRAIAQTLAPIDDEQRKLESKLWAQFHEKHPRILGALLTAVSHGLKTLPDVALSSLPRMADFAVWVTACEGALWEKGTFMKAYAGNIKDAVETVLENDQVATVLRKYMDTTSRFEGTATELWKALNGIASQTQQEAKGWPKSGSALSRKLRRIAPPLRKIGLNVTFPDRKAIERKITIVPVKVCETPSSPSSPSFSNGLNNLDKDKCRHDAVTDEANAVTTDEAAPVSDGIDGSSDGIDGDAVIANQLNNKGNDGNDGSDGISHTFTGRRGRDSHKVVGDCPQHWPCVRCGENGNGEKGPVQKIELNHAGAAAQILHSECAAKWFNGSDENDVPPVDERGAPCGGIPFMVTAAQKRLLRAYGYSDEEIANLAPQQAHEILAQEPRPAGAGSTSTINDGSGLSRRRRQELADWYEDQGRQRPRDGDLNNMELNNDLRMILREEAPQHVETEFELIMQIVFAV